MAMKTLVEDWYDAHANAEEHRLDEARLEFEVTKRIIGGCIDELGNKQASIIDVGGGPGRYGTSKRKHIKRTHLLHILSNQPSKTRTQSDTERSI